ncbi:hypothetical protein CRENBAI_026338 [Crenichthys baileyi]|uniref:Uncharacterized protein n=1 Tax=Crenichthys baileyi TaxID=28760 RepID=A0AAV9QYR0_9TELE
MLSRKGLETSREQEFFSLRPKHLFSPSPLVNDGVTAVICKDNLFIVVHIFPRITVTVFHLLTNHCITHTVLDYSHQQVSVEIIAVHLQILLLIFGEKGVQKIFPLAITPLTSSRFPFISVSSVSHTGQRHNTSVLLAVQLPLNCLDRP